MAPRPLNLAVVGATGLVGREVVRALEDLELPVASLRLIASERSAGSTLDFRGESLRVDPPRPEAFARCDIAFFATGAEVSRSLAPQARAAGAVVLDDSPAFRLEPDVPLVVPEVNAGALAGFRARGIVSNPSAAATALAVVLKPIADAAGIERAVVTTLQAVSGAGQRGVEQLEREAGALMNGREPEGDGPLPHRVAFNVVPQIGAIGADGTSAGEATLLAETRKVLDLPALAIAVTALRVPVFYGHSLSVNVVTRAKLRVPDAREVLRKAPGLKVLDDPGERIYPMPMLATNDDAVHVGRIREDASHERGLALFVAVDNVRKGAALNLVQIAEVLAARHL
jgi:aspartate-semialdehyde dehydrogenase